MKRLWFALLIGLAAATPLRAEETEWLDGQAVVVNTNIITFREIESAIADGISLLRRQYARQPEEFEQRVKQLRQDAIDALVERQLILHEYRVKGYNLPESLFERFIREKVREQFGDRVSMTRTLQRTGGTYESFARRIREDIIVNLMTREFVSTDKVIISPQKIESFYQENREKFKQEDQVKLRLIFLPQAADAEPGSARKLADEVLAKIKEGASFAEMASVYSADSNRAQGGDRGWERRSALREDLAKAAFALQAGQVSDVIEKPEGCYILMADEIKLEHIPVLADVKEDIERTLKDQEFARLRSNWVRKLRANSFVQSF